MDAKDPMVPGSLNEFVGQQRLKDRIALAIEGAKRRGESLGHILIVGPSDFGKSTLGRVVSETLKVKVLQTNALASENMGDFAGVLTSFEEGDFLLMEDIHMLDKEVAEFLAPAMKDFKMSITIDRGANARIVNLNLPRFTVFATATRTERIPAAFLSSFEVIEEMSPYAEAEFAALAHHFAHDLGFELDEDAALQIARSACVSPRGVLNRVRHVQNFANAGGALKNVTSSLTVEALKLLPQPQTQKETLQKGLPEVRTVPNTAFIMMWMTSHIQSWRMYQTR